MAKQNRTADLLKVLVSGASPAPEPAAIAVDTRVQARAPKKAPRPEQHSSSKTAVPVRGKAVQFYLHAEDEKIIRELAAWLAPHRKRINDSLVIKSALRAVKTGPEFLAAYDAAVRVDGRTRDNRRQSR